MHIQRNYVSLCNLFFRKHVYISSIFCFEVHTVKEIQQNNHNTREAKTLKPLPNTRFIKFVNMDIITATRSKFGKFITIYNMHTLMNIEFLC